MSRASVSARMPRALALCDRCQFRYNHDELQWQYQWVGPKLQNLRLLVCRSCLDMPQENLRTIILPPDPVPISNPRPEPVTEDINPNSPIGQSASPLLAGTNVGTLINGGGTYAAFDGRVDKPATLSAYLPTTTLLGIEWVGKDWNAHIGGPVLTASSTDGELRYVATGFTATAPNDMGFINGGATAYAFEGSSDAVTWTTISSTLTAGTVGETITASGLSGGAYRYHRFALVADGGPMGVAQLTIDTNEGTIT